MRRTGTPDRGGLAFYSNAGRRPVYLSCHTQAPSTGNLHYWDSRGLRRRFGLVAGAPSGRSGHALAAQHATLCRRQHSVACYAGAAERGAGEEERRRDEGTGDGAKEVARTAGGKAAGARVTGG